MSDAPLPEDPRDALIRGQAERIAGQAERITALEALIADLREELEAALRAGSRKSGNSSMPPGTDDQPGRKPPRRERRAAERAGRKKQGKQPGSPGASMTWEVPDRTGDHFPAGPAHAAVTWQMRLTWGFPGRSSRRRSRPRLRSGCGTTCTRSAAPAAGREVPRTFRTVHPIGWAIWKGENFAPTEEELLIGIQG